MRPASTARCRPGTSARRPGTSRTGRGSAAAGARASTTRNATTATRPTTEANSYMFDHGMLSTAVAADRDRGQVQQRADDRDDAPRPGRTGCRRCRSGRSARRRTAAGRPARRSSSVEPGRCRPAPCDGTGADGGRFGDPAAAAERVLGGVADHRDGVGRDRRREQGVRQVRQVLVDRHVHSVPAVTSVGRVRAGRSVGFEPARAAPRTRRGSCPNRCGPGHRPCTTVGDCGSSAGDSGPAAARPGAAGSPASRAGRPPSAPPRPADRSGSGRARPAGRPTAPSRRR